MATPDDNEVVTAATPPAPAAPSEKPLKRALRRIAGALSSRLLSLCWVTYTLGILWVLVHPLVTVTTGELKPRGTYISENALLVDSMDARVAHREELHVREWHDSFLAIPNLPPMGCGQTGDCTDAIEWLMTQLQSIDRVEPYVQHFNGGRRMNVYGILRAVPLADHKESIVLVTHYRNIGATSTNARFSGIALGLELLKFLSTAKWLAKDVILLLADDGPLDGMDGFAPGTDAWLCAYHMDPLDSSSPSLPMRAGLIRAAINLETVGDLSNANVVGVFTAGMNGQLPNLDLVNSVVSHTSRHGVPVVLDRCLTVQQVLSPDDHMYRATATCGVRGNGDLLTIFQRKLSQLIASFGPVESRGEAQSYLTNLVGMLRFMKTLAAGPSGPHGHFISYNIDAITFAITQSIAEQHWQGAKSTTKLLQSLELIVRSMSNLEEKLHQSFFLYVLPNNHHFVSVGEYYYTVALVVSPAICHLLVTAKQTAGMRVAFALAVVVAVEAIGLVVLLLLTLVVGIKSQNEEEAFSTYAVVMATTLMQAWLVLWLVPALRQVRVLRGNQGAREWQLKMHQFDSESMATTTTTTEETREKTCETTTPAPPPVQVEDPSGWRALKCVLLTLVVYAHCVLGILNYPMALFCAVPMAFFALVEPSQSWRQSSRRSTSVKKHLLPFWLVVSSPIGLFTVLSVWDPKGTTSSLAFIVRGFLDRINLLALPYLCCLYLPVHTLAVAVYISPPHKADTTAAAAAAKAPTTTSYGN